MSILFRSVKRRKAKSQKWVQSDDVLEAHLPPSTKLVHRTGERHKLQPEYDFGRVDPIEFLYDSEVGTKYRGSTVLVVKRWTKHEDTLLRKLVKKFPNNWIVIAERLEKERGNNDQPKNAMDCSRRFAALKKQKDSDWTDMENDLLLKLVTEKGCHWKLFEKYFEGRDKDKIRHHYLKLKREGRVPAIAGKKLI